MKIIAAAADRRLSNPDRGEPTMHSPSTVWPAHGVSDALRRDCLNLARRNSAPTFYGSLGGDPAMRKLADQFVAAAADNPHLRPLLGAEAAAVADRLYATLVAYWGGRPPAAAGPANTGFRKARRVPSQAAEAAWLALLKA